MSPILVSFHQKEGASIATGMSGRMKPMPRKAATSTAARSNSRSASRAMFRRRTGRRSLLRRSTSRSQSASPAALIMVARRLMPRWMFTLISETD